MKYSLILVIVSMLVFFTGVQAQTSNERISLALVNGVVVPMTTQETQHEAIAISGERIIALGSDDEILALCAPDTRVIDLGGRAVYPGFVDPHTHLLGNAWMQGHDWTSVQDLALSFGITSAADMFTTQENLADYIDFGDSSGIKLRYHLYLIYNDSCGGTKGNWFEQYASKEELAPNLFVGGIKVFSERSVCGDSGILPAFTADLIQHLAQAAVAAGWAQSNLLLDQLEFYLLVDWAEKHGHQVVVHAVGDAGIEHAIQAIATALHGRPNTNRHAILHNYYVRDDMLDLYARSGILAMVEPPSPCLTKRFSAVTGEENEQYFMRIADLVENGTRVVVDSDWPYMWDYALSPINKLLALTTVRNIYPEYEKYAPGSEYAAGQLLDRWQALRMMTCEAAYAIRVDDEVGTLEVGKLADIAILSANPLTEADDDHVAQIQVVATLVGGEVAYGELPSPIQPDEEEAANAGGAIDNVEVTLILHNGRVVPMTCPEEEHEAIAIAGKQVLALGTNEEILALASQETVIRDLSGSVVYPGFIDPHTHLFGQAEAQGLTLDDVQQLALENGITTTADMFVPPWQIEEFVEYAQEGRMRMRVRLYLVRVDSCGNNLGNWYEIYPADSDLAPKLTVGGLKIFPEMSVCNDAVWPVFSDELKLGFTDEGSSAWGDNELTLTVDELAQIIEHAQSSGYQVMFHAIGDGGIEATMDALEITLDGGGNDLRHVIFHNYYIRDDMLHRYPDLGVVAMIEPPSPCHTEYYASLVGYESRNLFKRWKDLLATGVHVAMNSDWPYLGINSLNPMTKLLAVISEENHLELFEEMGMVPCEPYPSDQRVSSWEGLRMMTYEAAYALRVEDEVGTLEPGKLADITVLSANPLNATQHELEHIEVLATYVDGTLEYPRPIEDLRAVVPQAMQTDDSGQMLIDDFSDGDLCNLAGSEWRALSWGGGFFGSPLRIEQDEQGSCLVIDSGGTGLVGTSSDLGGIDASAFRGVFVAFTSNSSLKLGLNVQGVDPSWPTGLCDVYDTFDIAPEDNPIVLRIPFDELAVESWRRNECPSCSMELDLSQLATIGIEIASGSPNTELRIYEVGFYADEDPLCIMIDLPSISWLASLNDDSLSVGENHHAEVISGRDSDDLFFGMEWKSPSWVDLGFGDIEQDTLSSATCVQMTLSASEPMSVTVWLTLGVDFCGNDWRNVSLQGSFPVSTEPRQFTLPITAFSDVDTVGCTGALTGEMLARLRAIILLPDSLEGELRVYAASLCDIPLAEAESAFEGVLGEANELTEIPGLEVVGNPSKDRYPESEGWAVARSVWDLQAWDGKLYVGSGNSGNAGEEANAGPVDVWAYDPQTDEFQKEFVVDEEQIDRFCPLSDGLYMPGRDARESWEFGNFYTNRDGQWVKYRTLPAAVHVYDIAEWDGKLVAAGHYLLESGDGYYGGGGLYVSDDSGRAWGFDFTPSTSYSVEVPFNPERPDVVRFTELFDLDGTLYASGWLMPRIYKYVDGTFEYIDVDPFPGLASSKGSACSTLPQTAAEYVASIDADTDWLGVVAANDPCMTARITRNVMWENRLVYIGATIGTDHDWEPFGLYSATSMKNGCIASVQLPDAGLKPRDLCVVGEQLYMIGYVERDGLLANRLYSTSDLEDWTQELEFETDAVALSLEVLGDYAYIGLGGGSHMSGNIYRLPLE